MHLLCVKPHTAARRARPLSESAHGQDLSQIECQCNLAASTLVSVPASFFLQTAPTRLSKLRVPGSITFPSARRHSKASMYSSTTRRVADEVPVVNSAPFRSSDCEMTSLCALRNIGISGVRCLGEERRLSHTRHDWCIRASPDPLIVADVQIFAMYPLWVWRVPTPPEFQRARSGIAAFYEKI